MKKVLLFLILSTLAIAQPPNYFYTTLTATITSTDTTCAINPNDTAYFGSASNFYATIYDTYYTSPAHARSRGGLYETVLIESRSGLTLQIVRARLGTTARNFNVTGRTYRLEATILNDIYDSLEITRYTDSIDVHRSALNVLTDSITSHNSRINASTQRAMDSVSAHRTFINANRDSIHRLTDTTVALRTSIAENDFAEKFLNTYLFNEEFDAGTTTTGGYGRYRWVNATIAPTITYAQTSLTGHVGSIRITIGSLGTGGIILLPGNNGIAVKFNTPNLIYRTRVSTLCADSTQKNFYMGMMSDAGGSINTPDIGIYFICTDGYWQAVTRQSSSEAQVTTTNVLPTVAFQTLQYSVNSTGTVVNFYIDGVLVASHNSYIPTTLGALICAIGTFNSSAKTVDVDYVKVAIPGLED